MTPVALDGELAGDRDACRPGPDHRDALVARRDRRDDVGDAGRLVPLDQEPLHRPDGERPVDVTAAAGPLARRGADVGAHRGDRVRFARKEVALLEPTLGGEVQVAAAVRADRAGLLALDVALEPGRIDRLDEEFLVRVDGHDAGASFVPAADGARGADAARRRSTPGDRRAGIYTTMRTVHGSAHVQSMRHAGDRGSVGLTWSATAATARTLDPRPRPVVRRVDFMEQTEEPQSESQRGRLPDRWSRARPAGGRRRDRGLPGSPGGPARGPRDDLCRSERRPSGDAGDPVAGVRAHPRSRRRLRPRLRPERTAVRLRNAANPPSRPAGRHLPVGAGPGTAQAEPVDPCSAPRAAADDACGRADRMAAVAAAAQERLRDARRAYDEHVARRDRAAATDRSTRHPGGQGRRPGPVPPSRLAARDRAAIEAAAAAWLREINRINARSRARRWS